MSQMCLKFCPHIDENLLSVQTEIYILKLHYLYIIKHNAYIVLNNIKIIKTYKTAIIITPTFKLDNILRSIFQKCSFF